MLSLQQARLRTAQDVLRMAQLCYWLLNTAELALVAGDETLAMDTRQLVQELRDALERFHSKALVSK